MIVFFVFDNKFRHIRTVVFSENCLCCRMTPWHIGNSVTLLLNIVTRTTGIMI